MCGRARHCRALTHILRTILMLRFDRYSTSTSREIDQKRTRFSRVYYYYNNNIRLCVWRVSIIVYSLGEFSGWKSFTAHIILREIICTFRGYDEMSVSIEYIYRFVYTCSTYFGRYLYTIIFSSNRFWTTRLRTV